MEDIGFQTEPELGDGIVEPRADRANGDPQHFGNLGIRKILSEPQIQNLALERRERGDSLPRSPDPVVGFWNGNGRGFLIQRQRLALPPRPHPLTQVAGNTKKISPRAFQLLFLLNSPCKLRKRLLNKIPGNPIPFVPTGKIPHQIPLTSVEEFFQIGWGAVDG